MAEVDAQGDWWEVYRLFTSGLEMTLIEKLNTFRGQDILLQI